ncbi:MAG: RNA polymerase factor sigma-54 [Deltaproteobacteria bacterium]|nr:RNA polymerase factor sigma-54 [Deltaproteobacteria bacterium]MCZ6713095.1 RNA polymerase factor sigma-54 [Deltaproteobacteria bacterium]
MALELRQQLKLTQQLVMTPQLQQAIKLLQLSRLELVTAMQQELVENPCLEEVADEEAPTSPGESEGETSPDAEAESEGETSPEAEPAVPDPVEEEAREPTAEEVIGDVDWDSYMESRPQTSLAQGDDGRPALEERLVRGTSLAEHLRWQLGFVELSDEEQTLANLIVGNLNENGYLDEDLEAIASMVNTSLELTEKVLQRVQGLDPIGVAARNLAECLLAQAYFHEINDPLVLRIIAHHLDLLQRKDYRGIARIEDVSVQEVAIAARVIGSFEPRPGRQYSDETPVYITPDIYVHKVGDDYHVVLNEDGMPKLRVSSAYRAVLNRDNGAAKETRDYVRERLRSAVWLIKSIHQRQRTIVKVMESIIRFQREYFDRGSEYLRPLNLRDVADDIGMHESTVSRVTTAKYVQTPHGINELKFFFNSRIQTTDGEAIASESVKEKIRKIIGKEDPRRPYSDQRIAVILARQNINIARRTVTKYREALRILSSTRRREIG